MKLSIASGKGGTGKTTLSTNLAITLSEKHQRVRLLDCDVEEPNCHIFLEIGASETVVVSVPVPCVDEDKCTSCGECGRVCRFSAIVSLKSKALTFPELCHSCGGCSLVCMAEAIREIPREVGTMTKGKWGDVDIIYGKMRIGEAMSPPLIKRVKGEIAPDAINIIDAPPGTTCPMVEAIQETDYVVLVTEPTPFGLNDLILAVDTVKELGLKHGVVINRSDLGDTKVVEYCKKSGIAVLAEIPFDRKLAEAYSRGRPVVNVFPEYKKIFNDLYERIRLEVARG